MGNGFRKSDITAKTVSFGTLKGGVGKTMTCFNVAGTLAKEGKRILLIDSDSQANLTSNIGLEERDLQMANGKVKGICNIYELDKTNSAVIKPSDLNLDEIIIKSPNSLMPNVDIIPSDINLQACESDINAKPLKEFILNKFLNHFAFTFNKCYDYILIDTNPSLGSVNQNAFVTSDSIVLISDTSYNSVKGLKTFIKLWTALSNALEIDNNLSAIVLNNVDKKTNLGRDIFSLSDSDSILNDLMIRTYVPDRIVFKDSESAAVPIAFQTDKKVDDIKEIYTTIVNELREREVL